MPPKHHPPEFKGRSFNCPHCGAHAKQIWHHARAKQGNVELMDAEHYEQHKAMAKQLDKPALAKRYLELIDREYAGFPSLRKQDETAWSDYQLVNVNLSECDSCGAIAIWQKTNVIYPPLSYDIEPNHDLPAEIIADFNEARQILNLSPRGAAALLRLCIQKICKHLGQPGRDLNIDIGALVKAGLSPAIQQALDVVRVIGNNAVHPGQMDLRDDHATAAKLFNLVNLIANDRITHPRQIAELYEGLPQGAKDGVTRRDRE